MGSSVTRMHEFTCYGVKKDPPLTHLNRCIQDVIMSVTKTLGSFVHVRRLVASFSPLSASSNIWFFDLPQEVVKQVSSVPLLCHASSSSSLLPRPLTPQYSCSFFSYSWLCFLMFGYLSCSSSFYSKKKWTNGYLKKCNTYSNTSDECGRA